MSNSFGFEIETNIGVSSSEELLKKDTALFTIKPTNIIHNLRYQLIHNLQYQFDKPGSLDLLVCPDGDIEKTHPEEQDLQLEIISPPYNLKGQLDDCKSIAGFSVKCHGLFITPINLFFNAISEKFLKEQESLKEIESRKWTPENVKIWGDKARNTLTTEDVRGMELFWNDNDKVIIERMVSNADTSKEAFDFLITQVLKKNNKGRRLTFKINKDTILFQTDQWKCICNKNIDIYTRKVSVTRGDALPLHMTFGIKPENLEPFYNHFDPIRFKKLDKKCFKCMPFSNESKKLFKTIFYNKNITAENDPYFFSILEFVKIYFAFSFQKADLINVEREEYKTYFDILSRTPLSNLFKRIGNLITDKKLYMYLNSSLEFSSLFPEFCYSNEIGFSSEGNPPLKVIEKGARPLSPSGLLEMHTMEIFYNPNAFINSFFCSFREKSTYVSSFKRLLNERLQTVPAVNKKLCTEEIEQMDKKLKDFDWFSPVPTSPPDSSMGALTSFQSPIFEIRYMNDLFVAEQGINNMNSNSYYLTEKVLDCPSKLSTTFEEFLCNQFFAAKNNWPEVTKKRVKQFVVKTLKNNPRVKRKT